METKEPQATFNRRSSDTHTAANNPKRRVSDKRTRWTDLMLVIKWTTLVLGILTSAGLTYLSTEKPKPINLQVVPLSTTQGSSVSLAVPLGFMGDNSFYINTTTVRLGGQQILSTPFLWMPANQSSGYSVSTYSGLPIGEYNVVVNVKYQLNPIRAVNQSFTLATLRVKPHANHACVPEPKKPEIIR